jgi:N utilization substance protein A
MGNNKVTWTNNNHMSELANAIKQICDEKGLSYESVIETIESALAAAYRKDFGEKNQNIRVKFNPETAKSRVYDVKTIVEDMPEVEEMEEDQKIDDTPTEKKEKRPKVKSKKPKEKESTKKEEDKESEEDKEDEREEEEVRKFNPKTEIQLSDAKLIKKTAKIGDEVKTKLEVPEAYGRMAAQTAKQVIIQRLREAERNMIFEEFKEKEKEVVSGVVQRKEGRIILIDLGKGVGILPSDEQIYGERYRPGDRIKVYIKEVNMAPKGPEIVLSRTADEILKKVFYLEIPEISNGLIELKAVAREAGSRSKVAVATESDNVDPIGSCVGQRGARIQTIIGELGGEKVDIIEYDEDPAAFIANALSPARILNIEIDEKENKARVTVSGDQFSLAIGKGGQNARLAARLTGWKVDIVEAKDKSEEDNDKEEDDKNKEEKERDGKKEDKKSETKDKQEEEKGGKVDEKMKVDEKEDEKKKADEKDNQKADKEKEEEKAEKAEKKTKAEKKDKDEKGDKNKKSDSKAEEEEKKK